MNIDDFMYMLRSHGICEKLDDFDNRGLPDLVLFSGGHAIFIFTEWTEQQQYFAKRISHQLAPHFIWQLRGTEVLGQCGVGSSLYQYTIKNTDDVTNWLNDIEEQNKDFDYLEKYSEG